MKATPQKLRFLTLVLIILALIVAACASAEPTAAPTVVSPTTLVISGSGEAIPVMELMADAYSRAHNDLAFEFLAGSGSGGGVKGVLQDVLDLGCMSRPPKQSELEAGISYFRFGTDKIVVATSPDLTITKLTGQQVKDIFMGRITNWSEVGGPDAPINVLIREEEDSATRILRTELFGDGVFAAHAVLITSEIDMQTVLQDAINTIGYLHYSTVRLNDVKVQSLVVDGHDPEAGDNYPFTRPLGVSYVPADFAKVQPFLAFIISPEAQALLAEQGLALAN